MKLLTWNCNGAFRDKFQYILDFEADIWIIQECEDPASVSKKYADYINYNSNCLWTGSNKGRGLGIFARPEIRMEKMEMNHLYRNRILQWFIPVMVNSKQKILACWNHHADAGAFQYIGQFWLFMQNNLGYFNDMIIAGDFNSNSIWDKWDRWWNHTDCVNELDKINITSVFHQIYSQSHGHESLNTFYLHKKSEKAYHIDYIFADRQIIKNTKMFQIGDFKDWRKMSDHVPLLWDFVDIL